MSLKDQISTDGAIFVDATEFGEPITYNSFNGDSVAIYGVVDRQLPNRMQELSANPTNYMVVAIRNHATLGRETVVAKKDTIDVAATYGGTAKNHLVTEIISGDAGIWLLKVR